MRLALALALMASACERTVELLPNAPNGGIGAACGSCMAGLTCYLATSSSPNEFPGGLCSHSCSGPADCPSGQCLTIDHVSLCLPSCDPSVGSTCRDGYSCCANQQVITTAGACAPTGSSFCGG